MAMLRHLALLLGAILVFAVSGNARPPRATAEEFVGPTQILLVDGDSVLVLASREWLSASVRHQEKLLRTAIRMRYWRDHIPPDMREVFDALGYPTGRVLLTPIGHTEELWYYGQLHPPLRFVDGELVDRDRFLEYLGL